MAIFETLRQSAYQELQNSSWRDLTLWLVAGVLVWYSLVLVYRATLHPLARYPGWFWWKLTEWPLIFSCYRGDRHVLVQAMHEKYGNVVRTGPNTLSFNTATALATIHGNREANVRRADWYKTLDASSGANSTQSVIDKDHHAFRRRIIAQAFSDKALRQQEVYVAENVDRFVEAITESADEWSPPKDYGVWTTYFGFDFVGDLSFGSSFDMLRSKENRYVWDVLRGTNIFLYFAGYLPFAPVLRLAMGTSLMDYFGPLAAETLRFFRLSNEKLRERETLEIETQKQGKESRKDIFHYLMNGKDPVTNLTVTRDELHADAGLLLAAGSDGTSMGMSALLFYLLKHPDCMQRLLAELRSLESVDELRLPKINQLPYLHAVLEESLRLSPPIPSAMPRRVLPGGLMVDGHLVPEGIDVGVPIYSIHRNANYYPAPLEFKPDRWMPYADGIVGAKRAFCTFSLGRMNCIGKNVAYLAMKLATAKLLYQYDVRVAPEVGLVGGGKLDGPEGRQRDDEYQMVDWMIGYREGPIVQFKKRTA